MTNHDLDAAWTYHNATKHSFRSVRHDAHALDWPNHPMPFKIYPTLAPLPLPREFPPAAMPALSAIAHTDTPPTAAVLPDLPRLAALLHFSAGITKRRTYAGREFFYRAAACTGALYEIELYLVCADLPDLPAGVYHFGPGDFALRLLRSGDYRGALVRATGASRGFGTAVAHAPVTLVCTGTYWRNAWKYQARAYRHFGWDNGTILANLLAMAAALALPARVVLGFEDAVVNHLLGLDTKREVAFSLVTLGRVPAGSSGLPPEPPQEIPPLTFETLPLSATEVDYPAMRAMHAASELLSGREAAEWHDATRIATQPINGPRKATALAVPKSADSSGALAPEATSPTDTPAARVPLAPLADDQLSPDPVGEVILRRGSTREFARSSITFAQLSTMLDRSTRGIPADFPPLNDLYLIANAVDGLAPGAYFFDRARSLLECLKEGDFRDQAGYLGLEQQLPADAAVAFFFLADLQRILDRFGNRGYRAVQLEAGILGGNLYLAAYAQRLGATGLTFYDDEVIKFFSPHAAGKSAIFLMAAGKSRKLRGSAGF